jgi:hypothetical protein
LLELGAQKFSWVVPPNLAGLVALHKKDFKLPVLRSK